MNDILLALLAGSLTGGLLGLSCRLPALGWLALTPLAALSLHGSALAVALAAGLAGALGCTASVLTPTLRALVPLVGVGSALAWSLAFGAAAWLLTVGQPGWIVVLLPLAAILAQAPLRLLGAPRWVTNPLARSQEPWLCVVHVARLGGDLVVTWLLATSSAGLALTFMTRNNAPWTAVAGGLVVSLLGFGALSLRSASRDSGQTRKLRVAAVVADGPGEADAASGPRPTEATAYRDIEGSALRYGPLISLAAQGGAKIVVLPEVSVYLDAEARPTWLRIVQGWARAHDVAIVAPYFNAALPRNELVIVDARGVVGEHEKQHPARQLEPARRTRSPVGPHEVELGGRRLQLSAAICVDLDYGDTARSARRARAILAAPSNDWFGGFERLHHRTAVWSAVIAGVPVVRATGHGISSIYDRSGRVLAEQSSQLGPVVLVADVSLP